MYNFNDIIVENRAYWARIKCEFEKYIKCIIGRHQSLSGLNEKFPGDNTDDYINQCSLIMHQMSDVISKNIFTGTLLEQ